MITYKVQEEHLFKPETGSYTSYGILAYEDSSDKVVCRISDIFLDRKLAEKYTQLFNTMNLEIVHLQNVIDDLLQSD